MNSLVPAPSPDRGTALAPQAGQLDAATGLVRHWLKPQLSVVRSLDHAANLLAAAGGQVCAIWDTHSHELVGRIVEPAAIGRIALSRDGQLLALATERAVKVYEIKSGALRFEYHHPAPICSVHIAAGARLLASADTSGRIEVHHLDSGTLGLQAQHRAGGLVVFIEQDGDFVISESRTDLLFIDIPTGLVLRRYSHSAKPQPIDPPHCAGKMLIGYSGTQVCLFNAARKSAAPFKVINFATKVTSVDIASDQSLFLVSEQYGAIHLYHMHDATLLASMRSFTNPVWGAKFGEHRDIYVAGGEALVMQMIDGRHVRSYCEAAPIVAATLNQERNTLLVSDRDGGLTAYDLNSGRRSNKFAGHQGSVSVVVANAKYVASGAYDGTARVREWNGDVVAVLDCKQGPAQALALDELNDKLWVGTFSGAIACFDLNNKQQVAALDGHRESIRTLNLSDNSTLLVSGDDDGRLCIWDLRAQGKLVKRIQQFGPVYRATFDGEASVLATTNMGVRRYNLDAEASTFSYPGGPARWFCVLDDGKLSSLSLSGTLRVFDMKTGSCLQQTRIDDPRFHRVVLALTPNRVITGSADSVLRVFDYQLNLLAQAHHLSQGVLWMTAPAGAHPGWLFTDRPELLDVGEEKGEARIAWPAGDARRARHLALFNSASHVMQVINDRPAAQTEQTFGSARALRGYRGLLTDGSR